MKKIVSEMQQKIDLMPDSKLADLSATLVYIMLGRKALEAFVRHIEERRFAAIKAEIKAEGKGE